MLEKTVMDELEQRNAELSSLLKSSEKSRADMETIMKEQNKELTTLRANTLIMETLEEEIHALSETKIKFLDQAKILEAFQKQEHVLRQRICDLEAERDEARDDHKHRRKVMGLLKKLSLSQDMLNEKDEIIVKAENTVKVLFEKCNMLGVNNKDIKEELKNCIESENYLKDFSQKIQFSKNYLEKEIEQLVRELKLERSLKEERNVELTTLRSEVKDCQKRLTMMNEDKVERDNNLYYLKEELKKTQKLLSDYESGKVKSTAWLNEIKTYEEQCEKCKTTLERKIEELQHDNEMKMQEVQRYASLEERFKSDFKKMELKVNYYEEHYTKNEEAERIRNELELKYKLEMNQQLQKVSAVFEHEQEELLQTMRSSIAQRRGTDMMTTNYCKSPRSPTLYSL